MAMLVKIAIAHLAATRIEAPMGADARLAEDCPSRPLQTPDTS
jgi:hypothetical protein